MKIMISLVGPNASNYINFDALACRSPNKTIIGTIFTKRNGSEDVMIYDGDSPSQAFDAKLDLIIKNCHESNDAQNQIFLVVGIFPDPGNFFQSFTIPEKVIKVISSKCVNLEVVYYPPSHHQ